jgi:hypothetical protein
MIPSNIPPSKILNDMNSPGRHLGLLKAVLMNWNKGPPTQSALKLEKFQIQVEIRVSAIFLGADYAPRFLTAQIAP